MQSIVQKDPAKVRAGRASARKRWGDHPPRVVRLGDLTEAQRVLVLGLIEAQRMANACADRHRNAA